MLKDRKFGVMVMDELKDKLGEEYSLGLSDIPKNNTVLTGITVKKEGYDISPTIYLESAEELYGQGKIDSFSDLAERIKMFYSSRTPETTLPFDVFDWEKVKPHVFPTLVNTAKNKKLLETCVSREFLDLSIIYIIMCDMGRDAGIIKIREDNARVWGISMQELHMTALRNLNEAYVSMTMRSALSVISDVMPTDDDDLLDDEMRILTTKQRHHGAAVMLLTDRLDELVEEMGSPIYILPASIHEVFVIRVPVDNEYDAMPLLELVSTVNGNSDVMEEEEVLTDSVYRYDRLTGKVIIAASYDESRGYADGRAR